MVNYCCVQGCGRNSRLNKHLNYYSLPKERPRQIQWLRAAGREDLLAKEQSRLTVSHRFCSRHFAPASIKNRHLLPDAVPTLYLSSYNNEDDSEEDSSPLPHGDIVCNNCISPVAGFRYKCVTCPDYDLCQKCEMLEAHPNHYMLRIPRPMKFKLADKLTKKWQKFFKAQHVTPSCDDGNSDNNIAMDSESSDDEPITKYAKNYDSGIDLSEDVKSKIRQEVTRVLKIKTPKPKTKKVSKKEEKKRSGEEVERQSKKAKFEEVADIKTDTETNVPEVVFADVNDIKDGQAMEMKTEYPTLLSAAQVPAAQPPVMHVKLSDDLSELMVEVISNNQKTVYKYTECE